MKNYFRSQTTRRPVRRVPLKKRGAPKKPIRGKMAYKRPTRALKKKPHPIAKTGALRFTVPKSEMEYWEKKLKVSANTIRNTMKKINSNKVSLVKKYLAKNK